MRVFIYVKHTLYINRLYIYCCRIT